jgi:glycosyltransferase involved in cell wall biosynthesis
MTRKDVPQFQPPALAAEVATSPQATAPSPGWSALAEPPTAIVHDWLLGMRGGEWVLAALLRLFPLAVVHALFYRPKRIATCINCHAIVPSGLNRLPGVHRYYRWLLPLLPGAVERMRLAEDRRLAITISHCVAHGVRPPKGAIQINYYLSPMRYLHDQVEAYRRASGLAGMALGRMGPRLRAWEAEAARRGGGHAWAISQFVARRIEQAWGVTPERVIYPPVRTSRFTPPPPEAPRRRDEFLLVAAMVPYKRVDLAIRVANRLGMPLRVVGGGPLLRAMRRLAGPSVVVEGPVGENRLAELYRTRAGLIFPGEEDFGIVPLEAMASGMPVLGLRAGGLMETHVEGVTGAFFDQPAEGALADQSSKGASLADRLAEEALAEAWSAFQPNRYVPEALRAHAEAFGEDRFLAEFSQGLRALGAIG